jgi:dihydrofolate reductase
MRRIVMFNNVSADGCFTDSDGSLSWVVQDEGVYRASAQENPNVDTILFGRRTYDMFEMFWPHALDDAPAAPDPHAQGRRSEAAREMAVFINEATKIVFSKERKDVTWRNSRLAREIDPRRIEAMKAGPGKDMIVFGSGTVVSQLTRHRLIDEYQFVVSPILLGGGRPLVSEVAGSLRLDLLSAKSFPSGVVMLRYAPAS